MKDADHRYRVRLRQIENQIVAIRQIPQPGRDIRPFKRDPRVLRKKAKLLIKFVAKTECSYRIIGSDVTDNAFQIFKRDTLKPKRRH